MILYNVTVKIDSEKNMPPASRPNTHNATKTAS